MPKIPEKDWSEFTDPNSREHSPSKNEIERNRKLQDAILYELSDIEERITGRNPYTGEKDKFNVQDPDDVESGMAYLYEDVAKITDPEIKDSIDLKFEQVRRKLYKMFIPFVDSRINKFGLSNSPLEGVRNGYRVDAEEVEGEILRARETIGYFKVTPEEKIDFESEIDRLAEKLERYKREPTLFSFEYREEKLQKKVHGYDYLLYMPATTHSEHRGKSIDSSEDDHVASRLKELLLKASEIQKIAESMTDKEIKIGSIERANSLHDYILELEATISAPRELLALEARIRHVRDQLKQENIRPIQEKITEFEDSLADLKARIITGSNRRLLERVAKKLEQLKKELAGEATDDGTRFDSRGVDWAWNILGIARYATTEESKQAYRKLAMKYHPDKNSSSDSSDKMKKINEAYEFVRRYLASES